MFSAFFYTLIKKMNRIILIISLCLVYSGIQSQHFVWATKISSNGGGNASSICVNGAGDVYSVGTFSSTCDFDPGTSVFSLTSAGNTDAYVQKLDASGNFVWAKRLGGSLADEGNQVATDSHGNVYITGTFYGSADFDPGSGTCMLSSMGVSDVFILKLDASGNFLWAKSIGSNNYEISYSIAFDQADNICISGSFSGSLDLDPGPSVYQVSSAGGYATYLMKLDVSGNFLWGQAISSVSGCYGFSIKMDVTDHIYMTGYYNGTVDFDAGPGTYTLTAQNGPNSFLLKLDASGAFVWAKSFGAGNSTQAQSLVLDHNDNAYVTGYFVNTSDFDPGPGVSNLTSNGFTDIFVEKFDRLGNYKWAVNMGGINGDQGISVGINPHTGNVYTTGNFNETADFDPGPGVFNLTTPNIGYNDVFISCIDSLGKFVNALQIGGTSRDYGMSIVCDSQDNIYTTGFFGGTVDFDPGAGISNLTVPSGYLGLFVLKLNDGEFATGVSEKPSAIRGLSVYPNPNKGCFTVCSESRGLLQLYSSEGVLIESMIAEPSTPCHLNRFISPGIYFLSGQIGESFIHQKIVITD